MTHEELLAKIENKRRDYYADDYSLDALRAVVELHKAKTFEDDELGDMILCRQCITAYPCVTIQAIEKEIV